MEAMNEFLARIPRGSDGNRRWPLELKAPRVAETLVAGATVIGMDFASVQIEEAKPVEVVPTPDLNLNSVDVLKGGVTIRLAAYTPVERIAEIVAAL